MPYTGIPITQKGVPNGVATLNGSGKVPTVQLPPSAKGIVLKDSWMGHEYYEEAVDQSIERPITFTGNELTNQDRLLVLFSLYMEAGDFMDLTIQVPSDLWDPHQTNVGMLGGATHWTGTPTVGQIHGVMVNVPSWISHHIQPDYGVPMGQETDHVVLWGAPWTQNWTLRLAMYLYADQEYSEFGWKADTYIIKG